MLEKRRTPRIGKSSKCAPRSCSRKSESRYTQNLLPLQEIPFEVRKVKMESRKLFRLCLAVLFGLCSIILTTSAHGQGAVITGKGTTEPGREIEGANVVIPELNISVGTNAAGNYTIVIPPARLSGGPATLRVRAIGFVPKSSLIALSEGPRTANFALAQDINRLEAVVTTGVTGATSQLKLPFTVSRIDSSDMKVPAANPLSQLAGKVPGAQIVAASGRPGASP